MNGTRDDFLNVCRSYLWVVEAPPRSNRTVIGQKFGWNGVAWCAEYASVCLYEAGVRGPNGERVVWTAGVLEIREAAKARKNGLRFIDWRDWASVPVGSGVLFDLTGLHGGGSPDRFHIDAAIEAKGSPIGTTLAGNWGDRVARLNRSDLSIVQGFVVWPFKGSTSAPTTPAKPTPPPPSPEDSMVRLMLPQFVNDVNDGPNKGKPIVGLGGDASSVWIVKGTSRWGVPNPEWLADYANRFGAGILAPYKGGPSVDIRLITDKGGRQVAVEVVNPYFLAAIPIQS